MNILQAIPAAPGTALGKALWLHDEQIYITQRAADPAAENQRLKNARASVQQAIEQVRDQIKHHADEAAIFDAHVMMLNDPDLLALAETQLDQGAEFAWDHAIQHYATQLDVLDNEYFRARAADIRDVGRQVLRELLGIATNDLSHLTEPVILLARDLTPSDTARMDKSNLLGFATLEGSSTSHTAILAKALGLPAVVGAGATLTETPDHAFLILDGSRGEIVIEPDDSTREKYLEQQKQEQAQHIAALSTAQRPAITLDGHSVEVAANIGSLEDAHNALTNGAEGVGLLRTEFLYMDRKTAPTEDEQYEIYRAIFEVMGARPVVIRTLDIGGDKYPSYMDLGHEANPFLGWRAIRVCLDRPDFFKTQLRAILRAAVGHDIRIMFPMIASLDELRRAKALLNEARAESGFTEKVQVGIMVEIPSVVHMADLFAFEVDFFSIGTNDLTQYTFAVDRTNPKVAALADACHPAILRQIKRVIEIAHSHKKWVGVCGELAGDPVAIPILLGLGLDEFSMSPNSIPSVKEVIRTWNVANAKKLAEQAVLCESVQAVREMVKK